MDVKNYFIVPDCEHSGDINHYTDIITENGGNILKVNWSGMEDDDAIIVYSCPYEKKELIKNSFGKWIDKYGTKITCSEEV